MNLWAKKENGSNKRTKNSNQIISCLAANDEFTTNERK